MHYAQRTKDYQSAFGVYLLGLSLIVIIDYGDGAYSLSLGACRVCVVVVVVLCFVKCVFQRSTLARQYLFVSLLPPQKKSMWNCLWFVVRGWCGETEK